MVVWKINNFSKYLHICLSSLYFYHFIAGKRKKRNTEEREVTSKDNENAAEINADEADKPTENQLKTSAIDSVEATLDDVFVESKKIEKKEKAKQARLAFQTNFKVRSSSKTIWIHFLPDLSNTNLLFSQYF